MAEDRSRPPTDRERLQSILNGIQVKIQRDGMKSKPYQIDDNASALLMHYIEEAVSTILQEGSLLAKHRDSNVVEIEDLQLILAKKYGIDVPGYPKKVAASIPHMQAIETKLNIWKSCSLLSKGKSRDGNDDDDDVHNGDNKDGDEQGISPIRKKIRK